MIFGGGLNRGRSNPSIARAKPGTGAPDDEAPRRAVPEAGQGHQEEGVEERATLADRGCRPSGCTRSRAGSATSVMCQRRQKSWKVVAENGRSKFCGNTMPISRREPDGDVGVAGEVAVDLDREAPEREQHVGRAVARGRRQHRLDELASDEVGDHDLLQQPDRDQGHRRADAHVAGVARLRDLRQDLARPDDRAGHDVREERQVHRQVDRLARLDDPAVHVDRVRDRLERVEADPDRQDDVARSGPARPRLNWSSRPLTSSVKKP